jgi:hypothetical protein
VHVSFCQKHTNSERTYGNRRLSILELAEGRRALLSTQPVANAFDKLGVRGPGKDDGTTHRGRAEKCYVLVCRGG